VSDQGFDFQPPQSRRPPRRFEPPPWERDQFEQRAREQAEREREAAEAAERERAAREAADLAEASRWEIEQVESDEGETSAEPIEAAEGKRQVGIDGRVDDSLMEQLILGLKAEETPTLGGVWVLAVWAGAILVLVGIAVGAWGVTVVVNPSLGSTGKIGGMVLLVMCMTFMGIGAWMGYRALRQQGVL
jgi:hypothetical protein